MAEKVGILGLGLIGRLTAELIMPHGYECYAVRRPSTEDFPDMGGKLVDTPRSAPLLRICNQYYKKIAAADRLEDECAVVYEILEEEIDKTPAVIIDCPISGTQPVIRAGKGVIMSSGDEAACERVKPMLEHVAPKTSYVGDYGTGIKLKLMINFMVGANTVALAEGMLFGAQMGIDSQTMLDIVGPSAAGSTVFGMRAGIIAERKWQPCAGPSKLLWKDLDIVEEQADALGLSAPLLRICNQY
jgi:3-hydroxyisobutyrate dehydrogenase